MTQVFHHHSKWEDYRAGFYALVYGPQAEGAADAAKLLADPDELYAAMSAVSREWPIAAEVNLTNPHTNRQAWLGQAACCFRLGVPEFVTKQGWWLLSDAEREAANAVADQVRAEWESGRSDAQAFSW